MEIKHINSHKVFVIYDGNQYYIFSSFYGVLGTGSVTRYENNNVHIDLTLYRYYHQFSTGEINSYKRTITAMERQYVSEKKVTYSDTTTDAYPPHLKVNLI